MEIASSIRNCPGESVSGDAVLVHQLEQGFLIGVVDGLGHGPNAALASEKACEIFKNNATLELTGLMNLCHKGIRGTRGAAATLVKINPTEGVLQHLGVGNVEVVTYGQKIAPINSPGVLGGGQIRMLKESEYRFSSGGLMVIHSDGISNRMELDKLEQEEAQGIAEEIIERWGKDHDDASCAVILF